MIFFRYCLTSIFIFLFGLLLKIQTSLSIDLKNFKTFEQQLSKFYLNEKIPQIQSNEIDNIFEKYILDFSVNNDRVKTLSQNNKQNKPSG